ncbi:hypothetical protein [Legionella sainthelensi]|uniref:hypothetical protein n=1 Tax=Legionella sainthelensi TaxID=28087 RepID=UPI001356F5CA|nr:hypothetical protein [Legionella sainthelensi]
MPLSRDDIAFSERPFNFLKSSEQAKYDEKALWVKNNFDQAVHPFSNSISGTMLCLLHALCFFQDAKIYPFTESPDENNFIKLFSSVVVYFSGGHSLHELISVLRLPEVINELQDKPSLKGFDLNGVFISSIFLNNNEQAFEQALQKAIVYNNHCILKNFLNIEVRTGKLLKQVGNRNIHDNRGDKATDTSLYNCSVVLKKRIRPNDDQISEQSESKKPKIAFCPK